MTHYLPMGYYLNLPWTYETTWSEDPLEPFDLFIKVRDFEKWRGSVSMLRTVLALHSDTIEMAHRALAA
jgi:hypothetical protein